MVETKTWRKKFIIKGPIKGSYCDSVIKTLETINASKLGRQVITMLSRSGVDIEYMSGLCDHMPKGSSPRIAYDPDFIQAKPAEFDPTVKIVVSRKTTFVYLYHELVHAARWATGQFIDAKGSTLLNPKVSLPEEYTVTGLYEYAGYELSENVFRKSLGLPRRPYYIYDEARSPDEFKEEVKRRMFLCLPDPPKHRREELVFSPNRFNQKINEWKYGMYIALDYAEKRKEFPHGYPEKWPP